MDPDALKMAEARAFATSLSGTAIWLNKLERLFDALVSASATASAALNEAGQTDAADTLLSACQAFELEFFGGDDGDDHPDAIDVEPTTPTPPSLIEAARKLTDVAEVIANAGAVLKIDGPATDEDVEAFATALYEVQAVCKTLDGEDKS